MRQQICHHAQEIATGRTPRRALNFYLVILGILFFAGFQMLLTIYDVFILCLKLYCYLRVMVEWE